MPCSGGGVLMLIDGTFGTPPLLGVLVPLVMADHRTSGATVGDLKAECSPPGPSSRRLGWDLWECYL